MKIFRSILPYVEKSLFNEDAKKVVIIYGPRQSGKTTLAKNSDWTKLPIYKFKSLFAKILLRMSIRNH